MEVNNNTHFDDRQELRNPEADVEQAQELLNDSSSTKTTARDQTIEVQKPRWCSLCLVAILVLLSLIAVGFAILNVGGDGNGICRHGICGGYSGPSKHHHDDGYDGVGNSGPSKHHHDDGYDGVGGEYKEDPFDAIATELSQDLVAKTTTTSSSRLRKTTLHPPTTSIRSGLHEMAARRELTASKYVQAHPDAKKIPEEYTVEFFEGKQEAGMRLVSDLVKEHPGSKIIGRYTQVFQGVSIGGIPQEEMHDFLLTSVDTISMVEEDSMAHATDAPSWGLGRIDQPFLPLDNKDYNPINNGAGVDIYILDSGVDSTHPEFSGRIVPQVDFTDENIPGHQEDPNGHGTHVAGIAAGATFGVAPGANIIPVRVLDSNAEGSYAWVLYGIDWVIQQHKAGGGRKQSVINLSVGGVGQFLFMGRAIKAAVDAGVVVVVSAGNNDVDSCRQSPAFSTYAITVAGSTKNDARNPSSNWGNCVDIFAPGTDIISAIPGGRHGSKSGTSMASAHVAGAAALLLEANPGASASSIASKLLDHASEVEIKDAKDSPNKLLFVTASPSRGEETVSPTPALATSELTNVFFPQESDTEDIDDDKDPNNGQMIWISVGSGMMGIGLMVLVAFVISMRQRSHEAAAVSEAEGTAVNGPSSSDEGSDSEEDATEGSDSEEDASVVKKPKSSSDEEDPTEEESSSSSSYDFVTVQRMY